MQIERAIKGVKTLGPNNRFVIWVNGCPRRCEGCESTSLQQFCPQNEVDILSFLLGFNYDDVDGITISGGEPFEQASDLAMLVKFFNAIGKTDILIYTGYTISELKAKNDSNISYILQNIAVLVDGPYIKKLDTGKGNIKGSENQNVIFIKPEYKQIYDNYYSETRQCSEVLAGNILIGIGIPTDEYIKEFTKEKEE